MHSGLPRVRRRRRCLRAGRLCLRRRRAHRGGGGRHQPLRRLHLLHGAERAHRRRAEVPGFGHEDPVENGGRPPEVLPEVPRRRAEGEAAGGLVHAPRLGARHAGLPRHRDHQGGRGDRQGLRAERRRPSRVLRGRRHRLGDDHRQCRRRLRPGVLLRVAERGVPRLGLTDIARAPCGGGGAGRHRAAADDADVTLAPLRSRSVRVLPGGIRVAHEGGEDAMSNGNDGESMRPAMDGHYVSEIELVRYGWLGQVLRRVARGGVVLAAIVVVTYAVLRARGVLTELQGVSLADCRRALDLVSVGDALVCFVGFKLAKELIRAVAGLRQGS